MHPPTIVDCSHLDETDRTQIIGSLRNHLINFNKAFCIDTEITPVLLTIQHQGELYGGLVGRIAWGWMHIEILWLSSELRGQGLGKGLIEKAEELARKNGCNGVHLDTFSFQAPDFYTGLGYQVFGKIDDYPNEGQCRYFLKKIFAQEKR